MVVVVVVAVSAAMVMASRLGLGLSNLESLRGGWVAARIQMAVVDTVAVMVAEDNRLGSVPKDNNGNKGEDGRNGDEDEEDEDV